MHTRTNNSSQVTQGLAGTLDGRWKMEDGRWKGTPGTGERLAIDREDKPDTDEPVEYSLQIKIAQNVNVSSDIPDIVAPFCRKRCLKLDHPEINSLFSSFSLSFVKNFLYLQRE